MGLPDAPSTWGNVVAPPTLSWNSARFLALILNALVGLLGFFEREAPSLEPDSLFALRVVQGHLEEIRRVFTDRGCHPDVLATLGNLSATAQRIAATTPLPSTLLGNNNSYMDEPTKRRFFGVAHRLGLPAHRKVDELLRWPVKDLLSRDTRHASSRWFETSNGEKNATYVRCLALLFKEDNERNENVIRRCVEQILTDKGRIGFRITRQVFFLAAAEMANATAQVGTALQAITSLEKPNETSKDSVRDLHSDEAVAKRLTDRLCANVRDELAHFRRDKRKLARLPTSDSIDLLMEQVFVCLQFGFVDFAEPHVLVTALAWQHPTLGCYTTEKPESVPQFGLAAGFGGNVGAQGAGHEAAVQSQWNDDCRQHTSSVVMVAMVVFLRYILDPGPWPEFWFADQLVQIDQIVAEDRFRIFKYIDWVCDSPLPILPPHPKFGGRLGPQRSASDGRGIVPKPPPIAWSPDLIAFFVLLLVFISVSVAAHHFLGGSPKMNRIRGKRIYPYAFKRL